MDLTKSKILYADMINAMQLNATILYEDEHALLVCDKHSNIYYAAALAKENAETMLQQLPPTFEILVTHDTVCNEALKKLRNLEYENICYHCAYTEKKPLTIVIPKGFVINYLSEKHIPEVIELYAKEMPALATPDYIKLNIDSGMLGIFHQEELCGFIGVHEGGYGSIGMLEVKEQYRRRGLAVVLERAMINQQIERGRIPYGEIFIQNRESLKLQEKVGIPVGNELTYWFYM